MKKAINALLLGLIMSAQIGNAMENKIKFDGETYYLSNPDSKTKDYNYVLKDENIGNWHTKLNLSNIENETNPTEGAAEFAHQIQSENPSASVLVYPEAGVVGYLKPSADSYEYCAVVFKNGKNGLEKFSYSKRFFWSENEGQEEARKKAVEFAEKNNKKYMELVNKEASKYKISD